MERSSSRLKVFAILVAIMFAALSTRLWFLQVLATEVYAQEAQNNSVRTAKTDALRGEIWTSDQFAREQAGSPKATPLVTNRKSLEVRVNKQELIESGRAALSSSLLPLVARAQGKQKSAEPKDGLPWKTLIADLEQQIPQLMEKAKVPGLSIAIIKDAKLFWRRGFGVKDNAWKEPVDNDTVF